MFYWQWVMKNRGGRITPSVVLFDIDSEILVNMSEQYPTVDFLAFNVETPNYFHSNILLLDRARKTQKQYLQILSDADYLYASDPRIRQEASLCGVKVFDNLDDLHAELRNPKVLQKVERIENWESAKNLLTRKIPYVKLNVNDNSNYSDNK